MKNKKMKALVSCGLGCALAMSLSPAVALAAEAAGSVSTDTTEIDDLSTDSDANTDVNIFGSDSQISVTVPVALTVAASGAPAANFAAVPNNYTIVNDSYFDVQVKSIKAEAATGWDYSDAKVTKTDTVTSGNVGKIHLDLFPGVATGTTGGTAITAAGVDTSTGSAASKWKIAAKASETTPTVFKLGINGNTKLDQGLSEDSTSATQAATLIYTIGRAV